MPKRDKLWKVQSREEELFEYYLSHQGSSSGFRVFGLERQEGIDLLKKNLGNNTVREYLANQINGEKNKVSPFIFVKEESSFEEKDLLPHQIQTSYLDYLAKGNQEINHIPNFSINGKELYALSTINFSFGLMDALSFLMKRNLYIYGKDPHSPDSLVLLHRFVINGFTDSFRALYSDYHYNLLVLSDQISDSKRANAQKQEEIYLSQIQNSYQKKCPEFHQKNTDDIMPKSENLKEKARALKIKKRKVYSSSESDEDEKAAKPPPKKQFPPVKSIVVASNSNVSLEDISLLIQRKTYNFPQATHQKSLQITDAFLKNRQQDQNLFYLEQLGSFLGRVRLFLEFNFCPGELTRQAYAQVISKELCDIIDKYSHSREREEKKFLNYARIYLGKVYVVLKRFEQAYHIFLQVNKGYTKTHHVDMAELILEGLYCPADLSGFKTPIELAISLLEGKVPSVSTTQRKTPSKAAKEENLNTGKPSSSHVVKIAHPSYLNDPAISNKVNTLKECAYTRRQSTQEEKKFSTNTISSQLRQSSTSSLKKNPLNQAKQLAGLPSGNFSGFSSNNAPGNPPKQLKRKFSQREIREKNPPKKKVIKDTAHETLEKMEIEEKQNNLLWYLIDDSQEYAQFKKLLVTAKTLRDREASEKYLEALNIAQALNNPPLQIQVYIKLGNAHYENNPTKWFFMALELLEKNDDPNLRALAYIGLGNARYTDMNHLKDTSWYLQALEMLGEAGDPDLRARACIGLGNTRYTDAAHPKDFNWYLEALNILGKNGDPIIRAQAYIGLGNARYENTQAKWYLISLDVLGKYRSPTLRALACIDLGDARYTDKDHSKDTSWYLQALEMLGEDGDPDLRARARIGLGSTRYTDATHPNDFLWYLEALNILGKNGDPLLRAQAYIGLGNAHYENTQAKWYLIALELLEKDKAPTLRAQIYIGLGTARYENTKAKWYLKTLDILEMNDDPNLRALAYIGLGNARYTDKNHPKDATWFLEALDLSGNDGNPIIRARAYIGLGNTRYENTQAKWYLMALDLLGKDGNNNLRAEACIGLGNARYTDKSHPQNASWYLQALDLFGKDGNNNLRAEACIGLGNARYTDKDHPENASWYLQALDLLGNDGNPNHRAQACIGLGNVRYTDKDHPKDISWYLQALDLLGNDGDPNHRAQACVGLGNARYTDKNHPKHTIWYVQALDLLGKYGPPSLRARICIDLGDARYTDKNHPKDTSWYLQALEILGEGGDPGLRARACIGLGNTRYTDAVHPNDFDWYLDALNILGKDGEPLLRAQAYMGLGNAHYENTQAKWYLLALELLGKDADPNLRAKAYIGLGNARYTDEAHPENIVWFDEALIIAQKTNNIHLQGNAMLGMIKFYLHYKKNDVQAREILEKMPKEYKDRGVKIFH